MILSLLRHAEAEPWSDGDFSRVLTEKGRAQSVAVGAFIRKKRIQPEVIVTSPVVRAVQTAEIVAKELEMGAPVVESFLACGMTNETAFDALSAYKELHSVMFVGHEPDFSNFVAAALGAAAASCINLRKASLTQLQFSKTKAGAATLEFFIPVRYL